MASLREGMTLGSYRLLKFVRRGKVCQIWEVAREGSHDRLAIKVLNPDKEGSVREAPLIKQEYAIGRTLKHPNVIKVHELVQDQDFVFVVMEYFPHPSLKQLLQANAASLEPVTTTILEQAIGALAHLHACGWLHRDIKPDNFLVAPDGDLRLIDFALGQKKKGFLGRLFSSKKIQGTRGYMSPEQIRGQAIDERSDIYSFGCTAFELLTGKPPFTGTADEVLNKQLKTAPPALEAVNRNVTGDFATLVKRMLNKQPDQRPLSFTQISNQLKAIKVFKSTAAERAAKRPT